METVKEYLSFSQFHGLKFLTARGLHWLERIFWLVCVLVSWYFSILLFVSYWKSFVTAPVSFVTDTNYKDWNTSLFSVSVCEDKNDQNVRDLARELYKEDLKSMEEVIMEIAHFRGTGGFINNVCKNLGKPCPNDDLKALATKVRSPCSKVFKACFWRNVRFDCCSYFLPLETELGICYSLNSLQTRETKLLDTASNSIIQEGMLGILLNFPATIFIHAPEDVPYLNARKTDMHQASMNLFNRYSYTILETYNDPLVRDVSIKQRDCRFPDENNLKVYRRYSYSACIVQCRLDRQIELCNCSSHLFNNTDVPCFLNGLLCLQERLQLHLPLSKGGLNCSCMNSCTEPQYDLFDNEAYGEVGKFAEIELTLAQLPTVRLKRQVVRDILDLVVSIGGSASLFVGASMLSFVEVFYYFTIRALWNRIVNDRLRKKEEKTLESEQIPAHMRSYQP